jgi:hypothetical protein
VEEGEFTCVGPMRRPPLLRYQLILSGAASKSASKLRMRGMNEGRDNGHRRNGAPLSGRNRSGGRRGQRTWTFSGRRAMGTPLPRTRAATGPP